MNLFHRFIKRSQNYLELNIRAKEKNNKNIKDSKNKKTFCDLCGI
jgi:hypothetical protein